MLSLIIPFYNSQATIERCLESVVAQTHIPDEIILVNDGSVDATANIAQAFAQRFPQIKLLTQPNRGVSAARNLGLSTARGEWIQFADSDDYLEPTMCETLLAAQQTQDFDCVICGFIIETEKGKLLKTFETDELTIVNDSDWVASFQQLYLRYFLSNPWNKLFRASIIARHDLKFYEALSLGEDLLFNLAYLSHCRTVRVIDRKLYHYVSGRVAALTMLGRADKHDIDKRLYRAAVDFYRSRGGTDCQQIERLYLRNCLSTIEQAIGLSKAAGDKQFARGTVNAIINASETEQCFSRGATSSWELKISKALLGTKNPTFILLLADCRRRFKRFLLSR